MSTIEVTHDLFIFTPEQVIKGKIEPECLCSYPVINFEALKESYEKSWAKNSYISSYYFKKIGEPLTEAESKAIKDFADFKTANNL